LPGYSKPSDYDTTTFTVTAPNTGIGFCNGYSAYSGSNTTVALGYNSSCSANAYLSTAAPTGGRTITLTSSDPSKLLLSSNATALGQASITVSVAAGSTSGSAFYVQSGVSTGSATITESVSGYNPTVVTINFTPSGFIVQGGTATTTFSGTSPVTVMFVQLDPTTFDFIGEETLRPGARPATVKLIETNTPPTGTPAVGSLSSYSILFNPGDTSHSVNFQPAAAGTAVITFGDLTTGYAKPSDYDSTTFTVTAPNTGIGFCNGYSASSGAPTAIPLGYNSACGSYAYLATAAPAGGRTITLTSSDPTKLLLSTSASALGMTSIPLSVPAGNTSGPTFYVQSLVSSGTATITETAAGYNSTTAVVNFTPSGFIVQGGTPTTTFSAASNVSVTFVQLDPATLNFAGELTMRPGASAAVTLTETDTPGGVGSLGTTALDFVAGDMTHTTTYQPTGHVSGTSVIGTKPLAGYSTPNDYATTTFTVAAPAIYVQAATVGNYLQASSSGGLGVAPPTPTVVTISAPTTGPALLLSTSESSVGMNSISFTVPAGQTSIPTFYVQSQGGYVEPTGGGTVTINLSVSAPGYMTSTAPITLYPSGFALQGSNFTTTTGDNPTTLTIVPAALDPTYLQIYQVQELVPNITTLLRGLTPPSTATGTLVCTEQPSGTCASGTFTVPSVTFAGNDNPNFLTSSFVPKVSGTGTFLISITSAKGFTNASSNITATVTAP
jgi:hypothetical protein